MTDGLNLFELLNTTKIPTNIIRGWEHFLGYVDWQIEEPKKAVTKEALDWDKIDPMSNVFGSRCRKFCVPYNAKNIKCTYEVEE